jgi:hypothetical protein
LHALSVCFKPQMNPQNFLKMYERPTHMVPLFPKESKAIAEFALRVYANAAELGNA